MITETAEKPRVFRTEIFNRISDIPAQEWTRLYPQVLENYSFFNHRFPRILLGGFTNGSRGKCGLEQPSTIAHSRRI